MYTIIIIGEKSLDLTYEIQAFTDAGIFIILNCYHVNVLVTTFLVY